MQSLSVNWWKLSISGIRWANHILKTTDPIPSWDLADKIRKMILDCCNSKLHSMWLHGQLFSEMLLNPVRGDSTSKSFAVLVNILVTIQMIITWCFLPMETCWHALPSTITLRSGELIQEKSSPIIIGDVNKFKFPPQLGHVLVLVECYFSTRMFYQIKTINSDAHTI